MFLINFIGAPLQYDMLNIRFFVYNNLYYSLLLPTTLQVHICLIKKKKILLN